MNQQLPIRSKEVLTTAPKKPGWEARYFGNEPRLSELVELYRELGFEVLVEQLSAGECTGCTECFQDEATRVFVIYTRQTPEDE